jgi:two-component system, NarL family, response regulator
MWRDQRGSMITSRGILRMGKATRGSNYRGVSRALDGRDTLASCSREFAGSEPASGKLLRGAAEHRSLFHMSIRVLMADDHPVVRAGIRALIANEPDMAVVAEAGDGAEVVALFDSLAPDVVLMDLRMPRQDGVASIRAIVAAHPDARIIALTSFDGDADIYRALDAGACGYLIKDTLGDEVVGAVRAAASGKRVIPPRVASRLAEFVPRADLTPREQEVLELAAKGLRNRDIALAIGRSDETVKVHLKHIMAKLGVTDRTEAVTIALQRGIIHLEG